MADENRIANTNRGDFIDVGKPYHDGVAVLDAGAIAPADEIEEIETDGGAGGAHAPTRRGALAMLAAAAAVALACAPAAWADAGGIEMHRLYNPNSGEHFYTASDDEASYLAGVGWRDEGYGWTAPESSSTPVFRLYNPNAGDHHYTTSEPERDWLVVNGWKYEGVGWYSDDARRVALFRQYNPHAVAGSHNFTTSADEDAYLASVGWRSEGVAWYGSAHGHSWVPIYQDVQVGEEPIYEGYSVYVCSDGFECETDEELTAHIKEAGRGANISYTTQARRRQVDVEPVYESRITGYQCSDCGATK